MKVRNFESSSCGLLLDIIPEFDSISWGNPAEF
jgi:hypothetical protein